MSRILIALACGVALATGAQAQQVLLQAQPPTGPIYRCSPGVPCTVDSYATLRQLEERAQADDLPRQRVAPRTVLDPAEALPDEGE